MNDIPRHDSLIEDTFNRIDQRAKYDDELVDESVDEDLWGDIELDADFRLRRSELSK